jgi:hypothetical protein
MIPGVSGRLLTASFIRDMFPTLAGVTPPPQTLSRRLAECSRRIEATLGSASSVRAITEVALLPLIDLLDLTVVRRIDANGTECLELAGKEVEARFALIAIAVGWGDPLERIWRTSLVHAVGADARWCLCCNGRVLRIVDTRRTWSRDYLEFDLVLLGREAEAQSVLWAVAHASGFGRTPALLDFAVDLSRHHGVRVCKALGAGSL